MIFILTSKKGYIAESRAFAFALSETRKAAGNTSLHDAVYVEQFSLLAHQFIDERELARELNDYRRDILRSIDGRMSALSPERYTELLEELADKYAGNELRILPQLEERRRLA